MYIRFGISGSAFPATIHRLDTKIINSADGSLIKYKQNGQVMLSVLWDVTSCVLVVEFVPVDDVKTY